MFRIITDDETWICSYNPETKQLCSPEEPAVPKTEEGQQLVKSLTIVLFDIYGQR